MAEGFCGCRFVYGMLVLTTEPNGTDGRPENAPAHRVRLLRAIRRIGAVPDANSFFDLMFTMMRDKNAAVRTAAREVIASLPGRHGEAATDR